MVAGLGRRRLSCQLTHHPPPQHTPNAHFAPTLALCAVPASLPLRVGPPVCRASKHIMTYSLPWQT
jgi:hypothetical protein